MIDVDHFKEINDELGHGIGDAFLKRVASVLQANVRGEDVAVRYGGEEFLVALPGASLEASRQRAEDDPPSGERNHRGRHGDSHHYFLRCGYVPCQRFLDR